MIESLVESNSNTQFSNPDDKIKSEDISIPDKLNTLKKLHEEGMITQDEYDNKRKSLLDHL